MEMQKFYTGMNEMNTKVTKEKVINFSCGEL